METAKIQSATADPKPYRPSWIDHLVDRIDRLPGPSWAFYLIFLLLVALLNNVILWLNGDLEVGRFDPIFSFGAMYIIYGIFFYHFLTGVVTKSLHDFFPVLGAEAKKEEELLFRMTHLPAGWGWLALVLGAILGFFDAMSSQYQMQFNSWFVLVYSGVLGPFSYGTFFALLFRTARQLFIIVKLHHQVANVDLFYLSPLRAFSRLTATAGFAVFFIGASSAIVYMEESDPSLLAFYIIIVLLGICIFIVPLISIRTRIAKEKKQRSLEVDQRIKHMLDEVRQCVENVELTKMGELNTTLSVLEKEKTIIKGISSYPWDPGTFSSFVSTIILPLLLWWIRTLLEKWM